MAKKPLTKSLANTAKEAALSAAKGVATDAAKDVLTKAKNAIITPKETPKVLPATHSIVPEPTSITSEIRKLNSSTMAVTGASPPASEHIGKVIAGIIDRSNKKLQNER